jgi:hypothetical protein
MLRLRWESLNPCWSEFVTKLFRDLEPLGHTLSKDESGVFAAEVCEPATITEDRYWDEAHRVCHQRELEEHREEIIWSALDNIRTGVVRPLNERPLIDWETAVAVWSRKFLPAPELVGEIADSKTKAAHREARQKRNERARTFPADQIRLSHLLRS